MLAIKLIAEGLGLGFLLYLICVIGIRNGAVGMVHLYDKKVQERVVELGLTTAGQIRKRSILFRSLCFPGYLIYVLICLYLINGARGFFAGFWQGFVILSVMNLIDRFLIDEYWVGHTKAWISGDRGDPSRVAGRRPCNQADRFRKKGKEKRNKYRSFG